VGELKVQLLGRESLYSQMKKGGSTGRGSARQPLDSSPGRLAWGRWGKIFITGTGRKNVSDSWRDEIADRVPAKIQKLGRKARLSPKKNGEEEIILPRKGAVVASCERSMSPHIFQIRAGAGRRKAKPRGSVQLP